MGTDRATDRGDRKLAKVMVAGLHYIVCHRCSRGISSSGQAAACHFICRRAARHHSVSSLWSGLWGARGRAVAVQRPLELSPGHSIRFMYLSHDTTTTAPAWPATVRAIDICEQYFVSAMYSTTLLRSPKNRLPTQLDPRDSYSSEKYTNLQPVCSEKCPHRQLSSYECSAWVLGIFAGCLLASSTVTRAMASRGRFDVEWTMASKRKRGHGLVGSFCRQPLLPFVLGRQSQISALSPRPLVSREPRLALNHAFSFLGHSS
jgi:hypothetical protein